MSFLPFSFLFPFYSLFKNLNKFILKINYHVSVGMTLALTPMRLPDGQMIPSDELVFKDTSQTESKYNEHKFISTNQTTLAAMKL